MKYVRKYILHSTFVSAVSLLVSAGSLFAANTEWQGATTGTGADWNSAANWTGGVIPGTADYVYFGKGATLTLDSDLNVGNLAVGYSSLALTGATNAGTGALTVTAPNFTVTNSLSVGWDSTGSLTVGTAATGESVRIGSGIYDILRVGVYLAKADSRAVSVDFSQVEEVNINTGSFYVLRANQGTTDTADKSFDTTLKFGQKNSITASEFHVASTTGPNLKFTTADVTFGAENQVNTNLLVLGATKAQGDNTTCVTVGITDGGTFTLNGRDGAGTKAEFFVAYNDNIGSAGATGNSSRSVVDFSNASAVNLTLSNFIVGYNNSGSNTSLGTLNLGTNATVTADKLDIATTAPANSAPIQGTLTYGGNMTIAGNVTLGTHSNSTATLKPLNGLLTVNGSVVTSGNANAIFDLQGGEAVVKGSLTASRMTVAGWNRSASLTVGTAEGTEDVVSIGNSGTVGDINICSWTSTDASQITANGTASVDFSEVETVNLKANNINILTLGTSNGPKPTLATVELGRDNTVTANTFLMGNGDGNLVDASASLTLGATNDFNVTNMIIGGNKAEGKDNKCITVSIRDGGTFTLDGKTEGALANLRIANNDAAGTGNVSQGVMDLSNAGAVTMNLDALVIGYNNSAVNGSKSTNGVLNLGEHATVNANSLTLGTVNTANTNNAAKSVGTLTFGGNSVVNVDGDIKMGNSGTLSQSTLNMNGGELHANSITQTGTANFNWTAGLVDVDSIGFALTQDGVDTILNPGGAGNAGTTNILGAYTLVTGKLCLEIFGDAYDKLNVEDVFTVGEEAQLVIDVLDPTGIAENMTLITAKNKEHPDEFEVVWKHLEDPETWQMTTRWEQTAQGQWALITAQTGGGGDASVPEPATWVMLVLGGGLLAFRRRNVRTRQ